ncbi:MAG: transcriptional regulator, TetR family [Streptosporangiaceae bacterium]|jgi:hypothetical protein|nr:transcriptional regulator, TetR family [Streptosporangiaceae bacterium]
MITAQWSVWESSVLGPCPDLLEALQVRVVRALYADVAAWLRREADAGRVRPIDPEAAAAVLIGSLTYYRIFGIMLGEPLAGVEEERLLRTWITIGTSV